MQEQYYKEDPRTVYRKRKGPTNISYNPKNKIVVFIVYVILLLIFIYFLNPVINPLFSEGFVFLSINLFIVLSIFLLDKINQKKVRNIFKYLLIFVIVTFFIINILSSPVFRSRAYYNLVGDVEVYDYKKQKPDISSDLIPVVDMDLAEKLGDKVLGEDIGLGSQYDIGEYYLVSTDKDLAWVAPLEPQSFFKWLQNKDSIPGYIYVSATNPNDVKLVRKNEDGKDINIKYSNNSYFNHKIQRYTYLNKNYTKGLTDFSFEIDDKGNPYWVVSTYKPTIGFSGFEVSGISVIDAQTGEANYYKVDDPNMPEWVDRVYPRNLIYQQLQYYGAYKNGWFNTITTQREMIQPTQGISYVFIDNKPYFYTGMTSVKSDEATVGFIIRDIKNKDTKFYRLNGATETAAQNSAQGKVQQYDYLATSPILLEIYNKPTYFMTLKDNDGLVKQYAFVSVENYNIVGIGDTVNAAQKDYYSQLKNNKVLSNNDIKTKDLTGQIERITLFENLFYFKLNNNENIFVADKDLSKELILSEKGDDISISYINDESEYKQVTKFENNSF